jgi:ABC-type transporter Mla MlaB component
VLRKKNLNGISGLDSSAVGVLLEVRSGAPGHTGKNVVQEVDSALAVDSGFAVDLKINLL